MYQKNIPMVVSYWNSTSNHNRARRRSRFPGVVSYWNSTSNHNFYGYYGMPAQVVSYWNSTSNHNRRQWHIPTASLYLIEILHQTTTHGILFGLPDMLYLIEILHQTTTPRRSPPSVLCCILLKFYIKPQPAVSPAFSRAGCILLKFYIKPQQRPPPCSVPSVVSYWNSTSNHNW